jgi:hypothetical protein
LKPSPLKPCGLVGLFGWQGQARIAIEWIDASLNANEMFLDFDKLGGDFGRNLYSLGGGRFGTVDVVRAQSCLGFKSRILAIVYGDELACQIDKIVGRHQSRPVAIADRSHSRANLDQTLDARVTRVVSGILGHGGAGAL